MISFLIHFFQIHNQKRVDRIPVFLIENIPR